MTNTMIEQWQDKPNLELVEFIVERFHQVHRQQLPELKQLALKIEDVHGDHPQAPLGLGEHLDNMLHELERGAQSAPNF